MDCSTNRGNSLWSYCSQIRPGLYQLCFHYQVQQNCMDRKAGCHGMRWFWGELLATWVVKGKPVLLAAKSRVPFAPLQISLRAWESLLLIATEFHDFYYKEKAFISITRVDISSTLWPHLYREAGSLFKKAVVATWRLPVYCSWSSLSIHWLFLLVVKPRIEGRPFAISNMPGRQALEPLHSWVGGL